MKTRVVFMGSPDFAVPTLQALADNDYQIVGVITQPDRPSGRGRKLTPPPVKVSSVDLGLPLIQPGRLSTDQAAKTQLLAWKPDIIIVAAFGQILKKDVLVIPPFGCINVHASLLPRWRGVSPIQAAILNGDNQTGITIMLMDEGIDTGDILSRKNTPIDPEDTGGSLFSKLAHLGGNLLIDTLPDYLSGKIIVQPQGDSPTPYAPMLKKSDGILDFNKPAEYLSRQVRAYRPWPGTYTHWKGKLLKIMKTRALAGISSGIGTNTIHLGYPAIGTGDGLLVLEELQPAGKKPLSGEVFIRGARDWGEMQS